MSQALIAPPHLPAATEAQVRFCAFRLVELAPQHGITELAFASLGRLRSHIDGDHDLFDTFEFLRDASDLRARPRGER